MRSTLLMGLSLVAYQYGFFAEGLIIASIILLWDALCVYVVLGRGITGQVMFEFSMPEDYDPKLPFASRALEATLIGVLAMSGGGYLAAGMLAVPYMAIVCYANLLAALTYYGFIEMQQSEEDPEQPEEEEK